MERKSRRRFFKDAALGTAGLMTGSLLLPQLAFVKNPGANNRINAAIIGCGGRGRYLARYLIEQKANSVYLLITLRH